MVEEDSSAIEKDKGNHRRQIMSSGSDSYRGARVFLLLTLALLPYYERDLIIIERVEVYIYIYIPIQG